MARIQRWLDEITLQDDSYEDWYEYEISAPVPVALGQVDTGLNNLLVNTTNGVMGYTNVIVVGQGENRRVLVVPMGVENRGPMVTGGWENMLMNTTVSFANDEGYDFTTQVGTVLDLVKITAGLGIGTLVEIEKKAEAGEVLTKEGNELQNDTNGVHPIVAWLYGNGIYNPMNALISRTLGEATQVVKYGIIQPIGYIYFGGEKPDYPVWTSDYWLDIPQDIWNTTAGSLGVPITLPNGVVYNGQTVIVRVGSKAVQRAIDDPVYEQYLKDNYPNGYITFGEAE